MSETQISPISAPHRLFIQVTKIEENEEVPTPATAISIESGAAGEVPCPFQENKYYVEWADGHSYVVDASHMYPLDLFRAFMAALRTYEGIVRGQPIYAEAPDVFVGDTRGGHPPTCPREVLEIWDTVEVLPGLGLVVRAKIEWWKFECVHPPLFMVEEQSLLVWAVVSKKETEETECAWITATSKIRHTTIRSGFYRGMDAFGIVYGDGASVRNEHSVRFVHKEDDGYPHAMSKVFVRHTDETEAEFVLPQFRTLVWREDTADPRDCWVEVRP